MKRKSVKRVLVAVLMAVTLMFGNVTSVAASAEITTEMAVSETELTGEASDLVESDVPESVVTVVSETSPEVLEKLDQVYEVMVNYNNLIYRLCELGDIMLAVFVFVLIIFIYYSYLAKFTKF